MNFNSLLDINGALGTSDFGSGQITLMGQGTPASAVEFLRIYNDNGMIVGAPIDLSSVWGAAGNTLSTLDFTGDDASGYRAVDTRAPVITSVALTSNAGTDHTYAVGDTVIVTATFDEDIIVNATGGNPSLTITVGSTEHSATYVARVGSHGVAFEYTIAPGDLDANGISIAFASLALNGGTIQDYAGNNAFTFNTTLTDNASHLVDSGVILAGQAVVDLGTYGKLIAPVQVEGNWYYYWDRSGDGTIAGGYWTTHDVLDGIFTRDINGNANPGSDTTDAYRYATLNGVQLALPTANGGVAYPNGIDNYQPGTAIDNSPVGEANPAYDDLLAIWDAHNGSGTETLTSSGTPPGWADGVYWSATPSGCGHAGVALSSGYIFDRYDWGWDNTQHVAFQVLFAPSAPVFTSAPTASIAENTATSTTVYDATADADNGITYTLGGTDAARFGINGTTGAVTFVTSPNFEIPTDTGANNIYDLTVTATDAAGNAANQSVAITVTDVVESLAGNDVIDLGGYGKLIAPVFVDGNWYYYWDRSGDGSNANSGSLNGSEDRTTHDVLDGIFTQDINGNANPGSDTTDTYRYATLNGVHVALPTHGEGSVATGYRPGTAIDNSPSGEANPTYDDLLAIWDGYEAGTVTGGTPPGWQPSEYWSATPSTSGHALVALNVGVVINVYVDTISTHVALQVL